MVGNHLKLLFKYLIKIQSHLETKYFSHLLHCKSFQRMVDNFLLNSLFICGVIFTNANYKSPIFPSLFFFFALWRLTRAETQIETLAFCFHFPSRYNRITSTSAWFIVNLTSKWWETKNPESVVNLSNSFSPVWFTVTFFEKYKNFSPLNIN